MVVALLHLTAVAALTGLSWTVQLTTYPAFAVVGPTPAWPEHHARHERAMVRLVALPWATQGVTTALLLLDAPDVPLWLCSLAAALGAATVAVTLLWSVPCHTALGRGYDDAVLASLLRSHRWRTALWSLGTLVALVVAARAAA